VSFRKTAHSNPIAFVSLHEEVRHREEVNAFIFMYIIQLLKVKLLLSSDDDDDDDGGGGGGTSSSSSGSSSRNLE